MVRFSANEYSKHKDCSSLGPMDFPPLHYMAPICVACNVEDFLENGEFARWIFTIFAILDEPYSHQRMPDEFWFWQDWFKDLERAAFDLNYRDE